MRKAYSYIRMSTDIQLKGDSLRRQLEASKKYACDNNYELVENIAGTALKDIGISAFKGANTQKGALSIFLRLLDEGKIEKDSILLVESLDRLSRDKITNALAQFMSILANGIEIVTLIDGQTYTQEKLNKNPGSLYVSVGVMFRANEESETKSNRLSAAWKNKRNNASTKVLTRTLPAWIRFNEATKELEIIKERGKVVKTIFKMCISTCGLYNIAKHLNGTNVPVFGKGKIWYRSYISKILNNRAVLGEFQPHMMVDGIREPEGDLLLNYFPCLIDEHTFHLARAAISRRSASDKGRKGENYVNIFSGFVYCGGCGTKMSARNRGEKAAKRLICNNKKDAGKCNMPEWDMIFLETKIIKHLRDIDFLSILYKEESQINKIQDEIISLNNQLDDEVRGSNELMDIAMDKDLNEQVKQRARLRMNAQEDKITALKNQIEQKGVALASEVEMSNVIDTARLNEFLDVFDTKQDDYLFRSSVNQLLSKLIQRIELYKVTDVFQPWDFDEENGIVKQFRNENPSKAKFRIDKLVEQNSFKKFAQDYYDRIVIHYKTGAVRHILIGDDNSLLNTNFKIQKS